jgi:hypothetical protein
VLVELEVLVEELVELEVEELVEVLEVMFPEVEVLVETLPEVDVELPPLLVDVEVELPLTLMIVPLELPDDEPLVLVLVVELIDTCPPPLEPPITTGVPPPPAATKPPEAGAGRGIGTIAICCSSTQAFSPSCSTRRLGASHS